MKTERLDSFNIYSFSIESVTYFPFDAVFKEVSISFIETSRFGDEGKMLLAWKND